MAFSWLIQMVVSTHLLTEMMVAWLAMKFLGTTANTSRYSSVAGCSNPSSTASCAATARGASYGTSTGEIHPRLAKLHTGNTCRNTKMDTTNLDVVFSSDFLRKFTVVKHHEITIGEHMSGTCSKHLKQIPSKWEFGRWISFANW